MPEQHVNRREFLLTAGAAAAACVATVCDAEQLTPPIVDTHQHLWDLKRFRLPWLDHAGEKLNRNHLMEDYVKACEGLNVVKAVYMEVAVEAKQRTDEAAYVLDLCRRKSGPTVAAVIGGSPGADGFAKYIGRSRTTRSLKASARRSTPPLRRTGSSRSCGCSGRWACATTC